MYLRVIMIVLLRNGV